jgi:hypothetical protein
LQSLLFDFGDAACGGELLELEGIVAGDDAVGGAGEVDHSQLCGDIGWVIVIAECGAGKVS